MVWLPEGDWFDFTTGEYFAGGRTVTLYGTLDDIPVFAARAASYRWGRASVGAAWTILRS